MIVDCFLARNEFDLVDFRINYLGGVVDKFIIGESEFTFGGERKPMFFSDLKKDGSLPDMVEVVNIVIPEDMLARGDKTELGDFAHVRLLEIALERYPEATFFYQDVDEIPSLEQVKAASRITKTPTITTVPMRMFYRKANWELARRKDLWFCPKLIRGIPEEWIVRPHFGDEVLDGEPGAHLSFLDSPPEEISAKLRNYEHEDFNLACLSEPAFLAFCDRFGIDHLARANEREFRLLNALPRNEYGDVIVKAVELRPQWEGHLFEGALLWRLLAAQVVFIYRESGGQRNYMKQSGSGIRPLGIIHALYLLAKAGVAMGLINSRKRQKRLERKLARVLRHIARR